jgi:hypothetical protein
VKKLVLAAAVGLASCGCIATGSMVLTPRGRRRIEELVPGDEVISIDPSTGERVATIVEATRTVKRETFVLKGDGWTLRCTSDHPLYDPLAREWAAAGDWLLHKRSALLFIDDESLATREVHITESTMDGVICELVDLSVAHELHNFVAEGILVHNKAKPPNVCATPSDGGTPERERQQCTCADGGTGLTHCAFGELPQCDCQQ